MVDDEKQLCNYKNILNFIKRAQDKEAEMRVHQDDSFENYKADFEWDSESDSDTDSVEEVQIKRYLNPGLESGLQQAKALQNSHVGLKRQMGHYQLSDLKHAVLNPKFKGYDGHHWDVDAETSLERSTPKLTYNAINREMDKEQRRRTKIERKLLNEARRSLADLNTEYSDNLSFSEKRMQYENMAERQKLGFVKDEVQSELERKQSVKSINKESEEERKRQIKLLMAMKSEAEKTPSITELVDGMAETNHKRVIIQQDLNEAFARLLDDQEEINFEYKKALTELLDESMIKMSLMLDRDNNKQLTLEEQIERIKKQHDLIHDKIKWESLNNFDNVLYDMQRIFNRVETLEQEEERRYQEKVMEQKAMVQEELVRRVARKWIQKATSSERARRIKEESQEMTKKDPLKESMRNVVMRLQRQMILQKFDGKWKSEDLKSPRDRDKSKHKNESEQDRKLRQMRTRNRRMSCVVKGTDDY